MKIKKINLNQKFKKVYEYWQPKVIAEMNEYQFKLAKVKDEFIWHKHEETDETFFIIKGQLTIELKNEKLFLNKGEMVVIPKGVEHRPFADKECEIMLIEPKETVNTGNISNEMTAKNNQWI
ncbi:MAG: cupin domain-containing protein [Candidatus Neomarinimicrobiota bacterium]